MRWQFGTPPAGNANYAWIQHMIHHLAPHGKIGLVLANGALSTQTSGEEELVSATGKSIATVKRIMKSLQDKNYIRRESGKRYGKWEVLV